MQQSAVLSPVSRLKLFSACLLSYLLIMMPFMQVAAATRQRTAVRSQKSATNETAKATAGNVSVNGSFPQPVPEPLFAPNITATKDDGIPAATKVAPGGTITYTVNISNSGVSPADDAVGVMFSDTIDPHTTLVPGSLLAAVSDNYNTIGNVQISVPDGSTDLLANDFNLETGNNTGVTATAETKSSTNCTGGCSNNVTINADGSFTYDPPVGFAGPEDSFTYTANSGTGTATTTVKIAIANRIWFINNNAGACTSNCDGRLSHPFQSIAAFNLVNDGGPNHPGDSDWIFVFESSTPYTGPATLRAGQKFIGQDATTALITLTNFLQPSGTDPLPQMNSGNPAIVNITGTNVNGINLLTNNMLRGFTVGSVGTGIKISGSNFGTLTVGNNTTPDVTLNGTGQALGLSTGTFAATSGFVSVASTSSATQGINLAGIGGAVSFGSTTISGSTTQGILIGTTTAAINFGNTSVTGGTDGISFQNNSAGLRTIGTLNVSGSTGNAFLHGAGGGNVTVTGAATLSSGNSAVAVNSPGGTNVINFQGATSATSTGAGNTGVNWSGTAGATLTFNSLSIQRNNGTALNATGGGTVTITNGTGSINNTTPAGAAIVANGVALNANFSSINSTGGTNGVSLTGVTGTSNLGGGSLTGTALGATFLVSGGTTSVTYSGGITQTNNAPMVSLGNAHSAGTITFQTGTLSASGGTGLQFDNADGIYNFNGTTTLAGGDAGIDIVNGSGGNFTFASGTTITSPTGAAFNVGTSPGNPIVTYSGSITQNNAARVVNIDGTTGNTITFNTGTLTGGASSTGININNANGNVTFSNGMTLGTSGARMTNQALTMTNGTGTYSLGAVSIFTTGTAKGIVATDADGTINCPSGTVNSAGAAAIDINGPVGLTTLGMTLTTVSANGGVNGISIQDTNGSFSVAGTVTGTDRCGGLVTVNAVGTPATITAPVTAECTGGTIQSTTAAGILISNATSISFNRMRIQNPATDGINITTINGFTLNKSFISDSAGIADDKGVDMGFATGTPINGSINITNSFIGPTPHDNFGATISSGTSTWNITNTVFDDSQLNSGFNFEIRGTSTVTNFTMDGCVLQNQFADGMQMQPNGTAAATMLANIQNSTFQSNNLGLDLNHDGTSTVTYRVITNTFRTHESHAINFFSSAVQAPATGGTLNGRFEGNVIGTAGTNDSGSRVGNGLRVNINGGADSTVSIINNTVRQTPNGRGIEIISRNGTGGLDATVTGNNVDNNFRATPENGGASLASIFLQSNCVQICNTLRSDVRNNTVPAAAPNGDLANGQLILVRTNGNPSPAGSTSTLNLVDTTSPISGSCTSELSATNTGSTAATAGCTLIAGPINTVAMLQPLNRVDRGYELAKLDSPRSNNGSGVFMSVMNAKNDIASNVKPITEFMTRIATTALQMPASMTSFALTNYKRVSVASVASAEVATNAGNTSTAASTNSQNANTEKAQARSRDSVVRSHHAKISRAMAPMVPGDPITANIGNLAAGSSVTITFQVTVDNPPNLAALNLTPEPHVENQGTVTANGGSITKPTDDPETVGVPDDKTRTLIDLFNTSTTLESSLNPSNFGDSVTFTATINETPSQGAVDPTGTVDFIDVTGGGNTVICDNAPITGPSGNRQATCTTSTLPAGPPNRDIRADYSGDGNFDPSQSNIVSQQVIACTPNPIVTSTADSGAGTLREALGNVCSAPNNVVTFNIAGPGPHAITLTTGELVVAKDVTINNNSGESITVSPDIANPSRVFNINSGKTAAIIGLTISGGTATNGGGILNDGTLTVVNSTLTLNHAASDGGAISNSATGTLTLINTTISVNNANGFGGGVDVLGGTATIINSTITNNHGDNDDGGGGGAGGLRRQGGTVTLKNTIIAGNFAGSGTSTRNDVEGAIDPTSSNNLIGDGTNMTGITNGTQGNQVGTSGSPIDPRLGSLANNGGTTSTHALLSAGPPSPAIDAGSNANLPADTFDLDGDNDKLEPLPVDQRGTGFPRVIGSSVDIGAFELGQADLSITKTDGVTTAVPGGSVTYTIVVTNSGPSTANGVTVSDTFPAALSGVTFTSSALGGATGNTAAGAGNISDTLNMPASSSVTYTVNAPILSSATGTLSNTATVTVPATVVDPNTGNNSATDTDTLTPTADLSITKTNGVASLIPGNPVTYTIVVTNNGPSDANGATVADTFPAELTGVTFTSVAAGGATGNTANGSGNISDTLTLMPAGSSVTYTVNATVSSSATGSVSNTATVTAPGGVTDPTPGNNSATDTDPLNVQADLSITKTDGVASVVPGNSVIYTIVVTNNGPSATGATVSDTFPAELTGVTFTSVTSGGATGNTNGSGNINDTVNMPAGSSITYTVNATVAASATGTLSNTATVTAPPGVDPTPGNNSATDTDTLTPSADVSVTKTDSPDPVKAGDNITYTITVTNSGPSDAQNLSLSDAVPANTTLVSVTTPAGWTRTDAVPNGGTGTLTFTRPTLAAGASSVFTVVVNVTAGTPTGTTITNQADVSSATADPNAGNNSAIATTSVQNQPNVSIQDASVVEPKQGNVNMIFTVTLSAPAPGPVSVNFATEDIVPASINTATAGDDYTATSGTVNFATGEQFKTILVSIKSDNKKGENNESFLVVLSNPVGVIIVDGTATGTIIENDQAGTILISELRTSGPAGANDDFVEIYNNTTSAITVNTADGGYGLFKMGATCSSTPVLLGVIPNGTTIPARGHFLFTGTAYSLADYGGTGAAAGDVTMSSDIESDRNVAIFSTTSVGSISSANRLDAVGFGPNVGGTCDLFREGTTLIPTVGSVFEYTYFRDECGKKGNPSTFGNCPTGGLTKDSNVNRDDFIFADTTAANTPAGRRLGAPGPQNLGSPRTNFDILTFLLDSSKGNAGSPNRERDDTVSFTNATQGTLSIRRRLQNTTGAPVTRLRIRVVDISTAFVTGGTADLRALTSSDIIVNVNDSATCTAAGFASTPCNVTVRGTILEQPPNQPLGGGFNGSMMINMGTPLAPGASVNLQILLGVEKTGSFKFFFNVEALP